MVTYDETLLCFGGYGYPSSTTQPGAGTASTLMVEDGLTRSMHMTLGQVRVCGMDGNCLQHINSSLHTCTQEHGPPLQ